MAFYFALLNVASKREEKQSAKERRRRHSIASVESPLLDYRLLPRPQIVNQTTGLIENSHPAETETNNPEGGRTFRRNRAERENVRGRGMRKSESSHNTARTAEQRSKRSVSPRNHPSHNPPGTSRETTSIVSQPGTSKPQKGKKQDEKRENNLKNKGKLVKGRGRGGRPLVPRRRPSPVGSTTSGSRRSSKESQRSGSHRDSPASSISSRRESSEPASLHPSSSCLANPAHKLSASSMCKGDKISEVRPFLKKVTFEKPRSPYIIGNTFLGENAVLIRRASGTPIVRTCSMAEHSSLTRQPYLPIMGCGMELWGSSLAECKEETQNTTNRQMESANRPLRSCILRRRSTSDKSQVAIAFRNMGFSDSSPISKNKNGLMTVSMDRPEGLCRSK